ncbi:carbohydrate porin [Beijerinckiaceae bacterium]|nr:carbohydrate porin [Beijerinckiaceae bacterium]
MFNLSLVGLRGIRAGDGNSTGPSGAPVPRTHRRGGRAFRRVFPLIFSLAVSNLAQAEDAILTTPTPQNEAAPPSAQPSISTSIPALGEFKRALLERGFNLQLNYTGEVLGNPAGGVRQGAIYEGLLEMSVDGDLQRIAGLNGATFHINAYQIHGRGLSTYNIFNYSTISGIEARPTTRLFELWFEQEFLGGFASVRAGQLAADTEFLLSDFDALYFNGTFGWPNLTSADLPGTGPHYPVTTPGVRLKLVPNDRTTLLFAVFNGDPAGVGRNLALTEIKDPAGINFRLRDPPFVIGEAQVAYTLPIGVDGLAGKGRIGGWHHFGKFDDYYLGIDGLSLANPASDGLAIVHTGDFGLYGIVDQMVWRRPGDDPRRGIGVFGLAMIAPPDRNLIDLQVEAGINFVGLWDWRPEDMFGMAMAYSRASSSVRQLDRDGALFAGMPLPIRSSEMLLELTYQAQIIPGMIVQPDFQYIFRPGAGIVDPFNPYLGRIRDAAVFGMRVGTKF